MDYTVLTSRSSIMEMARLIELIFARRLSSTYRVQFVLYSILRKFGYFQKNGTGYFPWNSVPRFGLRKNSSAPVDRYKCCRLTTPDRRPPLVYNTEHQPLFTTLYARCSASLGWHLRLVIIKIIEWDRWQIKCKLPPSITDRILLCWTVLIYISYLLQLWCAVYYW